MIACKRDPTPFLLALLLIVTPALADRTRLLETDSDSAQIRIDLARHAGREILAAYFIYKDDEAGLAGLYVLRQAARDGLDVRLIIDSQWNMVSRPILIHLADEGVKIRLYHKFSLLRPFWWTRRMHDKLLIVDGRHLVTGGRNIENPYFGLGEHKYVDRDIYIVGSAAEAARSYYLDLWDSEHVSPPGRSWFSRSAIDTARRQIDAAAEMMAGAPILEMDDHQSWEDEAREAGPVLFMHDEVAPRRKNPGIRADLVKILGRTEKHLNIESPYLVVTKGMLGAVRRLLHDGVHVRVLTNSLKSTDNVYAQAGYVGKKKKLVRMGVELWEYTGDRSLHSKTAVADGLRVIVGSYNLDPRSERLNTEIAVLVEDEQLADTVERSMAANLENAWKIGPDGKPEGYTERYPEVGWWKKVKVRLVRLLLPLIRRQL